MAQIASPEAILELLPKLPKGETYLKYLNQSAKTNKELVIALLEDSMFNIDYCTPENKANPDIMLAAVKSSAKCFPYVADNLKNDEDFLIKSLEVSPKTFKHMSEIARSNKKLADKASFHDKELEQYFGVSMKNNF